MFHASSALLDALHVSEEVRAAIVFVEDSGVAFVFLCWAPVAFYEVIKFFVERTLDLVKLVRWSGRQFKRLRTWWRSRK